MLATRPLLAATVVVPGILVLAYLWQKRRSEEANEFKDFDIPAAQSVNSVVDSKEVSLKLESLNRYRLDCIEEERSEATSEVVEDFCSDTKASSPEDILVESVNSKSIHLFVSEKGDSTLTEDFQLSEESEAITNEIVEDQISPIDFSFDTENTVLPQQSSESISNQDSSGERNYQEISEEVGQLEERCELLITEINCDIPEESKDNIYVNTKEIQIATNMTTEESLDTPTPSQRIPDVTSALKDPIASPVSSSPDDKVSDITSPVKSEASQKSESWSDLIDEEDELVVTDLKQNNLLNNDFKITVDKGGDGRNDSGVASPTEEYSETVTAESGAVDDKCRNSSGEDAGIGGSETGTTNKTIYFSTYLLTRMSYLD